MRSGRVFLLLAVCASLNAQTVTESIEVNVSSVDVIVTDRSGAHVHGLTKDDFELFDNGRPQPITNFSEYRNGAEIDIVAGRAAAPLPAAPAPVVKRPVALLLFIDNQHLQLKTRQRATEAVIRFLEAHAGDAVRVIVIAFDGHTAKQLFAGDSAKAVAALPAIVASQPPHELEWKIERKHYEDLIDGSPYWYIGLEYAKKYAEGAQADALRTIEALRQSADALRGFDGRKIVLYVTEGIPNAPGSEMLAYWSERFPSTGNRGHGFLPGSLEGFQYDLSKDLERLAASANASGVSLYSIDVKGTESDEFDIQSKSRKEAEALRGTRFSALSFLATQTGGTFIHNQNVFDVPLAAVAGDFNDYYSIGYRTPPAKIAAHRIEVRLKKRGLQVRSRQQYVVSTAEERIAARVESLFVAQEGDNPLALSIERGDVAVRGEPTQNVTLTLRVPRERLPVIGDGAKITFYVEARDPSGGRTPLRTLAREVPPSGDVVVPLRMTMRRGANSLAVGAHDDATGTLSLLRVDFELD